MVFRQSCILFYHLGIQPNAQAVIANKNGAQLPHFLHAKKFFHKFYKIMKINSINIYNLKNQTNFQKSYAQYPQYKQDSVTFKGNEEPKKTGFLNSLKKLFNGTSTPQIACYTPRENVSNLNEDEIKSETIKKFVGETIASYNGLIKQGKLTNEEIQEMLKLGKIQGYQGTVKYNQTDNANIIFGKINPETNLPSTISLWKNGEFMYSYEILSTNPIKYKLNIQDNGIDTIQEGIGNTITTLSQHDKKFKTIKQFDTTQGGFNYLYGKTKEDGFVEIKKRLYFDFYDIKGCMYGEGTQEGIPLYMYNQEQDLWEEKYLIEFED